MVASIMNSYFYAAIGSLVIFTCKVMLDKYAMY
jgi:hypothetical protein